MSTPPPESHPAALISLPRLIGEGGLLLQHEGLTIYLDPRDIPPGAPLADVICLSYVDPRAVSERDVLAVSRPTTIIAGLPQCVSRFRLNQLPLQHGQSRRVLGLELSLLGGDGTTVRWRLRWPDLDVVHPL